MGFPGLFISAFWVQSVPIFCFLTMNINIEDKARILGIRGQKQRWEKVGGLKKLEVCL